MQIKSILAMTIGSLFIVGCAGTTPDLGSIGKSGNYESSLKSGDYKAAAQSMKQSEQDDLLWYLDAGLISSYAKDHNATIHFFDKSEDKIKQYDQEVLAGSLLANAGAVITNDTFMDYRPRIYEGIMVNTYKGMNFLSNNDFANARIEFNRALERQRRAKDFFAAEIKQEQEKIDKEESEKMAKKKINANQAKSIANNNKTKNAIEQKYSNLFAFQPYPDFVNPFTSYMAGLFFISTHDYAKATDILKETYGMIKDNEEAASYVKEDLEYAMQASSTQNNNDKNHYAWVIFSNGEGPSKEELRFDIPLFLVTNQLSYTGIALPTFKERPEAFPNLVLTNGTNTINTKQVASMDKIIKAEFEKRFPTVMTRAITRTVAQSLLQYQLRKNTGLIGGILGAVYQGFMNRADTRQWKMLPKNFQIARIPLTSSLLHVNSPANTKPIELNLDPNKNHIVYIRIPTQNSKEIINEISF